MSKGEYEKFLGCPEFKSTFILCFYTVSVPQKMLVRVAQLYEDGGRPLPRHRAVTRQPTHQGTLTLTEEHDRELRRSVRCAHLRDTQGGVDLLPPLRDAVVIWIGESSMTVTGFETDGLTRRAVAQSWYVEIAAAP